MNKILLLSSGLEAIKDFAGQPSETLRMAFIPAAGKSVEWLKKSSACIQSPSQQII